MAFKEVMMAIESRKCGPGGIPEQWEYAGGVKKVGSKKWHPKFIVQTEKRAEMYAAHLFYPARTSPDPVSGR